MNYVVDSYLFERFEDYFQATNIEFYKFYCWTFFSKSKVDEWLIIYQETGRQIINKIHLMISDKKQLLGCYNYFFFLEN